jgi:flagellar protein FlbT
LIDFPLNAAFTNGLGMPGLVLELKQDELIIINGAAIRFRTKSRIEINGRARFLFGKQILLPAECNTPARSIYLALQTAYVGSEDERSAALDKARRLIDDARGAFGAAMDQTVLDRMIELAEAGESYEALKLARGVIRYEDALAKPGAANAGTDRPTEESAIRQSAQSS